MKTFLVIGFGGMGCRHAQSILDAKLSERVFVIESSDEIFNSNVERIGYTINELIRIDSIDSLVEHVDLAIVATSSEPRFQIVKQLLNKRVKTLLLEKVVFQSLKQFDEVIELAKESKSRIFGNLPNRYFSNFIEIKRFIASAPKKVKMTIAGGEFGLACNSIHYIDLFYYLTGFELGNNFSQLNVSENINRRGTQYRELNGIINIQDNRQNGEITIISDKNFKGGVVITININGEQTYLFENEQIEYSLLKGTLETKSFVPIPSSKLTASIIKDIFEDKCLLPEIEEMRICHALMYNVFNPAFQLSSTSETICPIT